MLLLSNRFKKSPVMLIIGLFCINLNVIAQRVRLFEYPDSVSTARVVGLSSVAVTGTSSAVLVLGNEWYSSYNVVPFHFFNDNQEWLQIDKFGHGLSAYYGGVYGYNAVKWSGMSEKKSLWIGGVYGFGFLLGTEIMDGYSSGWGASYGDLVANGIGTGLFVFQQAKFKQQLFCPKFSFHFSKYAKYRPELLGSTKWDRWLKDYNGQTYWLTFSPADFIQSTKLPKWLGLSIGYGADGMLGGKDNPEFNSVGEVLPFFERHRQYYLSFDLNFQHVKTNSAFFNAFLRGISFVKIPSPTVSFDKGLKFFPLYY